MLGKIIINGNVRAEADVIYATQEHNLNPQHLWSEVTRERTGILITAAWRKSEHNEGHIKKALYEIGIEP